MNVELGMRKAEKEMAECLIFTFSAFRIPNSEFLELKLWLGNLQST